MPSSSGRYFRDLPSSPTRRSSDLITRLVVACRGRAETMAGLAGLGDLVLTCTDRKSTRLNSSHLGISYAVFFWPLLPRSTLFPYTTLFRSDHEAGSRLQGQSGNHGRTGRTRRPGPHLHRRPLAKPERWRRTGPRAQTG